MKNLKFVDNETEELFGNHGVYKAYVDTYKFEGQIYEIEKNLKRIVYHYENNNLDEIKKALKRQLEVLGVKFEKQIRKPRKKLT